MKLPQTSWGRLGLMIPAFAAMVVLLIWRGPEWNLVADAFRLVEWKWVVAAIALNLMSVIARAAAWHRVIEQAMPPPRPGFRLVFSAFGVGLFANAVLPGRIGELARVAVLTRHQQQQRRADAWATLVGTVFAHRVFDLFPVLLLIAYVLFTAKVPHWALTSLVIFAAVGFGLFAFALASARRHQRSVLDEAGQVRRLVMMARYGLGVMREPAPAAIAVILQCIGWTFQLLAVWATMRAFDIHVPLPAAGLVLLLMNVAMLFPLWPGNIGLVQAAVALPLVSYGVPYARGFAFGIGLQAIEMSVGVGVGLIFLAREGLSYAMLKHMPGADQAEVARGKPEVEQVQEQPRARARVAR
ncbi:MAG TPA: lysylphosphatidylglycerol synthase transmembrane domain-containing protein [Gaiellaceae bacterium]|nr:lysylphosphatidylglycerol synthase transmembrane domain-containing protein [Gaiellaceae bacterium]